MENYTRKGPRYPWLTDDTELMQLLISAAAVEQLAGRLRQKLEDYADKRDREKVTGNLTE